MRKTVAWASAHPVLSGGMGGFLLYFLASSAGARVGIVTGLRYQPIDWLMTLVTAVFVGMGMAFMGAFFSAKRNLE